MVIKLWIVKHWKI